MQIGLPTGYWAESFASIGGHDSVQMRGVDFHMQVEQAVDEGQAGQAGHKIVTAVCEQVRRYRAACEVLSSFI